MHYSNIQRATFLRRPNRFIAHIEVDGREEVCHVKNTGRCRELLTIGQLFMWSIMITPTAKLNIPL